jgi:hypothetical protein
MLHYSGVDQLLSDFKFVLQKRHFLAVFPIFGKEYLDGVAFALAVVNGLPQLAGLAHAQQVQQPISASEIILC